MTDGELWHAPERQVIVVAQTRHGRAEERAFAAMTGAPSKGKKRDGRETNRGTPAS